MSDLTPTNAETLERIKWRAKQKGLRVTLLNDAKWGMGGINVYMHPEDISIKDLPGGEDGERAQYRQAWFMSL
jgi:hypothetical protein